VAESGRFEGAFGADAERRETEAGGSADSVAIAVYTGSCQCGAIRFRIASELAPIELCHCRQCRKAQGAPFASNAPIRRDAFHLDSGADLLTHYESSPGKMRVFCSRCGSPIYSSRTSLPDVLRIRVGLINEPVSARPVAHIYAAAPCNWWPITDSLPQFPEAYITPKSSPA
jgi:hypothetical protein